MDLFSIPDPLSMYESAKTAGLERDIADRLVSATLSGAMSGLWSAGQKRYLGFAADAATAMYLSLTSEPLKGIALTVPQAMLAASNLSRFQTEKKA